MRLKKSEVIPQLKHTDPELFVTQFIATKRGDKDRGPMVWLNIEDARFRMAVDGELVWVIGPRGKQLAPMKIDDAVKPFTCIIRDIAGVNPAEYVKIHKPDLDNTEKVLA